MQKLELPSGVIVLLMGPTASGKSALAEALAQRFPAEIVSIDSAQVYQGMDIGTAKPSRHIRAMIPHHLIDIVSPLEHFSAAACLQQVRINCRQIAARQRLPILVGGTMLYFKVLYEGMAQLPPILPSVQHQLHHALAQQGSAALWRRLQRDDPVMATRVHPADSQRILHALAVQLSSGIALSDWWQQSPSLSALDATSMLSFAICPPRSLLHTRIVSRFDTMLERGFVNEVRMLRTRYPALNEDHPAMRCVGYRQVWRYLQGEYDIATMRTQAISATRGLVKRQLTWLRGWQYPYIELDHHDQTRALAILEQQIRTHQEKKPASN